ncbi:AfsR/SARP family transcriptional regulator [Nocardiopsis lucentensis]|uniref:AfsR/SARP family transcriptional regulator n=1 Tax=Nocardiopsis lucentensis TaxID=53441 RepID=UPI000A04108E|nr:AfsR/SARP family transcriptional regulator [Nocardiopsis lucentensis]
MQNNIHFRILGPLSVRIFNKEAAPRGKRQKILLTMLLLNSENIVDMDRLIDATWGDRPPATAKNQIRICVSELRRKFQSHGLHDIIETHSSGYLIRIPEDSLDLTRFGALVVRGRQAIHTGDTSAAAEALSTALGLWQGPIASGVDSPLVRSISTQHHENRLSVLEEYFDLELRRGGHHRIIGELTHYVAEYPFRERLCGQLMLALYQSNRQVDALELFHSTRRRLADDLGLEPSHHLRELENTILTGAVPDLAAR